MTTPTATRAPRIRKSGEDRRHEIAEAALRVIAAHGLRRFTTAAIAAEVGVTDGALFRHFPTKEAIVLAAIDRVEELLFQGFPPEADDPLERLGAFFLRRVGVIRAEPGISRLLVSEELAFAAPPEGVSRVSGFRDRSVAFVQACLAEAERHALLAPGVGADEATVVVLGAILALGHHGTRPARGAGGSAQRVWAALETFLRGPARPRSAGSRPPRTSGRTGRRSTP
ncbi:TetR/AcrR family transcriptional regulator [Anaeromyxobacter oryzae]|uniref:HTH tetR-type domain-containing protein n=1 Tax=Anaeromyxobacter oryzae TaxID=2918170 RepID=A0ABM7WP58_9BACT|nr:TetR/AcrR family transcriptional regulator [Anaeromyxobacter oryzae]BDG01240.1 hypothetical protein AMOR_02360 [Anaeromyxobacter oryzae]